MKYFLIRLLFILLPLVRSISASHYGNNNALVRVERLRKGRRQQSIRGFPYQLKVSPGQTDPLRTLAHGKGLVSSISGEKSSFIIQPKDSFGNDRLPDQDADLFAVYIYPEQKYPDGSFHVHRGILNRQTDGSQIVDYIPEKSGHHTIAIVQAVTTEQQIVTTSYNTKGRGGSFMLQLGTLTTHPIPWDADEDMVAEFLNSAMGSVSNFRVKKEAHGLLNYRYTIYFDTAIGDVPNLSVDTTNLLGSDDEWDVTPLVDGKFSHINNSDSPELEIQQIILQSSSDKPLAEEDASYILTFKGQGTNAIPWDADADTLRDELMLLNTVGDIIVSLETTDTPNHSRSWTVTFNPHEGRSPDSLTNFGNLPSLEISVDGSSVITGRVETLQNGNSPYRMLVAPSVVSPAHVTAYDLELTNFEGLRTGTYKEDTYFYIQSRDAHSNIIEAGPVSEVQIIETSAASQIHGFFEVTMFGSTVRYDASAFTAEVEKGLQSIPGVGGVSVSSNSAKDLVAGKTVAVTKGLDTIVPTTELTEFVIGDWIRIGDQNDGQLFSIIDMSAVPPFTVTLSSFYLGESQPAANVYQHGSKFNRNGYQYIVTFDPTLGDIPELSVDGALLEGIDPSIDIISCDLNVHQKLQFSLAESSSSSAIEGHFYLSYQNERTRFLSVDSSADDIEDAIISDISFLNSISISEVVDDLNPGARSIHLSLDSFHGPAPPNLLFAENYMMTSGRVDVIATCPMASPQSATLSAQSVAGRRGQDFEITLSNNTDDNSIIAVDEEIAHVSDGLYLASYVSPRVGLYSLAVKAASYDGDFFHIEESPFEVNPEAVEPSTPTNCSLDIADWNSLNVRWSSPTDDGGSDVTKYLIEWWDASAGNEDYSDSVEIMVDDGAMINSTSEYFSHTIEGLIQSSGISDGFGVQISAANENGYGMPSPATFLKPYGPPLPPTVVELERVPTSPSTLALHFTSVPSPDDRSSLVSSYFVEWSMLEDFTGTTVFNTTLRLESIASDRLPSYGDVNRQFHKFIIGDLIPGIEYYVRIAAINEAGMGPSSRSFPSSLAPGSKPSDLEDQHGVSLTTLVASDTVSVLESSSSLHVSWRAPASNNGFAVTSYLVEYWIAASGTLEVQEIILRSSNGGSEVQGTFAISYNGDTTDSLSINASAEDVQYALESLSSIRSVKVWRSGENPDYVWTVTFLSEYPSVSGLMLVVKDTTELADELGGSPILEINLLTAGEIPIGYKTESITVTDALETQYSLTLTDLTAGQPIHVQVSVGNYLGYGHPQASTPRALAPPIQKPSIPRNVILRVVSSQSLEVTFTKPESDGGDDVTLYRIEWDTNSNFDSNNNSPVGSYSFLSPKDGVGCDPCIHQVSGLTKGQEYYVRVYAYNSKGYSLGPGLPTPRSLAPKTAPDPPAFVNIAPISDTAVHILFPPSADDGGAPVTKYKIRWDATPLYSKHNIQSITLSSENDDISGTFRVAFGGHSTEELSVSSTAYDMKVALESLPTVGSTVVSHKSMPNGVVWAITFLTNVGDEGGTLFGPIESLSVSIDPDDSTDEFVTDTIGISGPSLLGTGARLVVKEEASAFKGFEQQRITSQCSTTAGIVDGHFAISVDGVRTQDISHDASALDLKLELEKISSIGEVKVTRRKIHDRINSFQWTIIFVEKLGNVPLLSIHDHLTCSDVSSAPLIFITEDVQGILPEMDGQLAGEIELDASTYTGDITHIQDGLMRGVSYHFQVSAWNGAGDSYGRVQYSTPAVLTPMDKPDPPSSVEMTPIDNSTVQISWNSVLNKGGSHQIVKYKAEMAEVSAEGSAPQQFNESTTFDIHYKPEVQAILLESSADDLGGFFSINFMGESTSNIDIDADADDIKEALEGISTIDSVDVTTQALKTDFLTTYGQRWLITFNSPQGDLPSMLIESDSDGNPSTIARPATVSGSSSVVRVETISDGGLPTTFITPPVLEEGKSYVSRVSSFNAVSGWSDPTESQTSISPSTSVPSPPWNVRVSIISDTELGISWEAPLFDGGALIAGYRIQWDEDDLFNHASATVGSSEHSFLLDNLDPNKSYFVRVMAFNSRGHSEPSLGQPFLCPIELLESL